MKTSNRIISSFAAAGILLVMTLGCLGPGSEMDKCSGIVEVAGKTFVGGAKTEEQAGLNACNKFCVSEDSEYDSLYKVWLTSEKAKRLEKSRGKPVSKEDAVMEDKTLLDYVTKNCAVRCVKEANRDRHKLQTGCK